jgi:5-formyltetrahydrofolate cyclo-ligase
MKNIADFSKKELRKHFRNVRDAKVKLLATDLNERHRVEYAIKTSLETLIRELSAFYFQKEVLNVSAYYPIKSEINTIELLEEIGKSCNINILLPKVYKGTRVLRFFEYDKENLIEGSFGVMEPLEDSHREKLPDVVLTPFLAFDNKRHRLGYGMGYYDSTFNYFKQEGHKYLSIGIGYDEQYLESGIPSEPTDVCLNYIITPSLMLL